MEQSINMSSKKKEKDVISTHFILILLDYDISSDYENKRVLIYNVSAIS